MAKKIYPNDLCPCGSGEKYKKCCGAEKKKDNINEEKKDREDFILDRLCEDATFLANAVQLILGPYGYNYCTKYQMELETEYRKDRLRAYVQNDTMQIYKESEHIKKQNQLKKIRPYGGDTPEVIEDILSLARKGFINMNLKQVELFHAYLMDNLSRRFEKYFYVPSKERAEYQVFGAFAHRGYDFLVAITIYLELQLGVHLYLDKHYAKENNKEYLNECKTIFETGDIPLSKGVKNILLDYANVIIYIYKNYRPKEELDIYKAVGAYDDEEYADRLRMITPGFYPPPYDYNYIDYLRYMISATFFNRDYFYMRANSSFPECDFVKYMCGLESIIEVFEEKMETRDIDFSQIVGGQAGSSLNTKENAQSAIDIYHTAVFNWMDELNGMANHSKVAELKYLDFAEINEDEFTKKNGKYLINPARKTTRKYPIRKLRMEIYNLFNGHSFTLGMGETPGDETDENFKIVGKYPILPWVSSGKEKTVHCEPFNRQIRDINHLYSEDIKKRQEFLTMEYRLTEIPVNCIEEYLNPEVYYDWKERNDLLKETQQKNIELERHIRLNQELVRSLSHSSANYLDSEKLAQTGIALQKADRDYPTLENLHLEGLALILQSEQERYLLRQLNSLVWRCSADVVTLTKKIQSALSRTEGVSIVEPIEFALKVVLSRVLFREFDLRSAHIKTKLQKTEAEWTMMQSSFMLDILAQKQIDTGKVVEWWNQYIGELVVNYSRMWEKLKITKDREFYDLVIEIVTEQILNALSHGDVKAPIMLELDTEAVERGLARWAYILCKNTKGVKYNGGKENGISTLNECMLLLNKKERGVEKYGEENEFSLKVWIQVGLLRAR